MIEQAILVDENDNIVGYKNRAEIGAGDRFRMAVVWLENSNGEVLIHLRSPQKKIRPNIWENAAGGGVAKGETYEQAAYKELSEEIGIDDIKLEFVAKTLITTEKGDERFCAWYKATCDKNLSDFKLDPREVAEIRWVNKKWLLKDRNKYPEKYMPSSKLWEELFYDASAS